jgi:hypothetical protein
MVVSIYQGQDAANRCCCSAKISVFSHELGTREDIQDDYPIEYV